MSSLLIQTEIVLHYRGGQTFCVEGHTIILECAVCKGWTSNLPDFNHNIARLLHVQYVQSVQYVQKFSKLLLISVLGSNLLQVTPLQ